ncbi:hypothetical protein EJB05_43312, partial [Eragrostis curvula]
SSPSIICPNPRIVVGCHVGGASSPMIPFSLLAGSLLFLVAAADALSGYQINCGAKSEKVAGGVTWVSDAPFINVGNVSELRSPGMMPMLASLRYFPDTAASKYCYVVPAEMHARYLVRTTYYYGGFDGRQGAAGVRPDHRGDAVEPGGHRGGLRQGPRHVLRGRGGGHGPGGERVPRPERRHRRVQSPSSPRSRWCGWRTPCTAPPTSPPTRSAPSRATASATATAPSSGKIADLGAIHVVAANYPDDHFNRYWEPYNGDGGGQVVQSETTVATDAFWNKPPQAVFRRGLTAGPDKSLEVQWPPAPLPNTSYYLALYFQDNRAASALSWRVFDVAVNGKPFFVGLNVSTAGSMVYGAEWPLSGPTTITLTPAPGSPVGPVINAAEIMMVVPLGGRTHPRDGVTCSQDSLARVTALNLTNFRVGGSISENIANLTAISSIWFAGNNLTGAIPDMSPLHHLVSLHLEDNALTGPIPESLGSLPRLQELFVQNNNLQGTVPNSIRNRSDIKFQYTPGNNIS